MRNRRKRDLHLFMQFLGSHVPAIKASLTEAVNARDEMSDAPVSKDVSRWTVIEQFLKQRSWALGLSIKRFLL